MMYRVLVMGLALAAISSPALGCEMHGWGMWTNAQTYGYDAMSEQDRLAAEQRAAKEFHDKKMAEAKSAFLSRFRLKADDSEAASEAAASDANTEASATAEVAADARADAGP